MTPREIIANVRVKMTGFATGSIGLPFADEAIEALTSAGYRILGPGEWDAETLEKCAEVTESAGNTWSNTRDPFQACQEAAVDEKCTEIAAAIRALAKEKQGC